MSANGPASGSSANGLRRRHSAPQDQTFDSQLRGTPEDPSNISDHVYMEAHGLTYRLGDVMSSSSGLEKGHQENRSHTKLSDEGRRSSRSIDPRDSVAALHDIPPVPRLPFVTSTQAGSLRRMVVNRDMNEVDGSVVELDNAGPSAEPMLDNRAGSKKSTQPVVAVKALFDDTDPLPRSSFKVPGIQGISALPHYETWIREKATRSRYSREIGTLYLRARKFVLRISEIPPTKDGRHLEVDPTHKSRLVDERTNRPYISNIIRSSRYTPWNFLPRQLFAQFSKLANFYFLCVSILQLIPGLSTTGTFTTLVPLMFFVGISMAKEGYDDFRRNRLDREENDRQTSILHVCQPTGSQTEADRSNDTPKSGPINWAMTKWKDVKVGDIVRLNRDEPAPADLILLHSLGKDGTAYIETMALDGETNLKDKQATPALSKACETMERLAARSVHVVVEDPNLDLYNFEGRVTVDGETSPMTNSSVIYRGSILRNTPEILGLVIYSGEECKIRMNANKRPRTKAPSLQGVVNKIVILVVIFVLALAIFNTIAYEIWAARNAGKLWYLLNAGIAFVPVFISYIILFNTMIPLSLYVSLEIIKLFQMLLLNDMDMYDEVSDTPLEARTSTINEELGQISYIFSDKTGTLTDNSMNFRKLSVAGTAWLHDADLKDITTLEANRNSSLRKKRSKGKKLAQRTRDEPSDAPVLFSSPSVISPERSFPGTPRQFDEGGWKPSAQPDKAQLELNTRELIRYIQRKPHTAFAKQVRMLLLSIAICHSCLPEKQQDGSIAYQAASPDELALVQAAKELGYVVIDRKSGILSLETHSNGPSGVTLEQFEILDVIEFSSSRKRMSVIVRCPDRKICVICKGADSVVAKKLRLSALATQKRVEIEHRDHMRRSMEAQQVMARKSDHRERFASTSHTSISLPRISNSTFGRPSISLNRSQPQPGPIANWLNERGPEPVNNVADRNATFYNPRPSLQLGRSSMTTVEARPSSQFDDDFELVEEALVVDATAVIERCFQHVNDFATEGLRTLLYGYRYINEDEYSGWKKLYHDATTSLVDRQARIEQAGELIETDFELAGATAIEDKLQNGVPEAIDKLRRANIKMWMLTGDKRETAINIGHSCRLIHDYSAVTVLDHENGKVERLIAGAIIDITQHAVAHSVVVVDGQTLAMIEADVHMKKLFYNLATMTESVICCRASPSQKAGLIKAVRHKVKGAITLAIGDGANDIAMIQEAHVGIGITGKEGLQAARTSDYSIAQFRFLTKLLLVHGRWNYIRTCKYTAATFWKEMIFYLIQAIYQRYDGFTGTSLYENWSLSMFNTLFTSLPVIFLGIMEKDLAASTLLAVPELYMFGQRKRGFNLRIYLEWAVMAAVEAIIIFFVMLRLYGEAESLRDNDIFPLGDMCFTAVVVIVSIKLQLIEMHNRSVANAIAIGISIGGWVLWNVLLADVYKSYIPYRVREGLYQNFGRDVTWWLTLILALMAVLSFEMAVKALKAGISPDDADVFRELEKDPNIRRRFEEASAAELRQGWSARGKSRKISMELERDEAELARKIEDEAKAQAERESKVAELLKHRRGAGEGTYLNGGEMWPLEAIQSRGGDGEGESSTLPASRAATTSRGRLKGKGEVVVTTRDV